MVRRTLALFGGAFVWGVVVVPGGVGAARSGWFGSACSCPFVRSLSWCFSLSVAALLRYFRCILMCPAALAFTALLVGSSDFFLLFLATLLHPFLELPFLFGLFFFFLY